ncbi:peptide/nickel transport system permease protein [Haloactinopolyspora alba]|uniref:Peptide/nickel transport system permease protein n=1 Tax=Haloactinopolyspora alba TaxID=648780 RepID=A0A2P8E7P0_9ACTN|nr:ABC transporter permease [Haloactinopolyspora alba]PSL05479.1 peptide/nickel transport system permease protein [Haloactinopolyspora alba]
MATADPERAGEPEQEQDVVKGRSPWRLGWERLRHDHVAMAAAVVIVLIGLAALLAGVVSDLISHPPDTQYREIGLSPAGVPQPPDSTFWFGTDGVGRDVFVRVLYGTRISLLVGIASSFGAVVLGTVIGMLAGFYGGAVDTLLARALDVILSMPFLLFGVALAAVLGPSLWLVVGVIVFFTLAAVGRIVRGQTLSIREREYVEAARSLGASNRRIMFTEILPNVLAPVLVYASLLVPIAIIFSASLSFLGLGVPPGTPAWGVMLREAIDYYTVAPWLFAFPGGALLLTTLAFNLLGDGVRDALDPKASRLGRAG